MEGAAVLHGTHFHTKEPVEDDRGRVWRASLDFAFLEETKTVAAPTVDKGATKAAAMSAWTTDVVTDMTMRRRRGRDRR